MNIPRILTVIALTIALTINALAGTPEEAAKKAIVTVSFADLPAGQALQRIAKLSGVKVHYTAPAKDESVITISLQDVSASEAFDYVARLANLILTYKDDGVHFAAK